ncbi:hypothetical protein [Solimonas soli]|uniref:hypothetical protein n=1 Tax=Solimonas soli TaxID=413479 RepID=UPI0004B3A5EB|nr:hypothetical protein [Solimonas soli]
MKTSSLALGAAALSLFAALPATAQMPRVVSPVHFGFVLEGAAEFGGDEVARVYYENDSSDSVDAGRGLGAALGFYVQPAAEWSVRATVGYKYESTRASNADIYLDRVPVDVIATWHFPNGVRLGAGGAWHTGIKFHGDDIAPNVKFDDAFGVSLEAGWRWFVARYTSMDYKDEFGNKYDADSYGLHLVWEF